MSQDDKRRFQQSPTTTFRHRHPTSPEIANRGNPNMVVDFSRQQSVVPTTLGGSSSVTRTMNAGGAPMALDVMVGGSPDARAKGPATKAQQLGPQKGR